MNLDTLYYYSELCKDMHITKTAGRLFISQQTLSNHLARLEEACGTPLLLRKPKLSLTDAGEEVLRFARLVCHEQANLTDILAEIEKQERGVLRFGASPLRMNACLPQILPSFTARYPRVELRLTDDLSASLEPMVLSGELDFAAVLSSTPDPNLISEKLMTDPVYFCVSDELLKDYYGEEAETLKEQAVAGADMRHFSRLPFCFNDTRLGKQIRESMTLAGIKPHIYAVNSDTLLSLTLCRQNLAACFATHMRLASELNNLTDQINIFPLRIEGRSMTQTLSLIRRKDRFLTHFSKFFLDLLFRYFSEIQQIQLERKV